MIASENGIAESYWTDNISYEISNEIFRREWNGGTFTRSSCSAAISNEIF